MFLMSGAQIRLQVPPKLFGVNSWIPQMIRQWIPDCWSGDKKCTGPKGAAANLRNWQLMTSTDCRCWWPELRRLSHARYLGARWRRQRSVTASLYCTRWEITSQCRSSCISRDRPHSYFRVLVTRCASVFWTSTFPWPSSVRKTKQSCSSRRAMWPHMD